MNNQKLRSVAAAVRHAAHRTFPERHWRGSVSIENLELVQEMDLTNVDLGVQIASNGWLWLCVNGIAFIRFRPQVERAEK